MRGRSSVDARIVTAGVQLRKHPMATAWRTLPEAVVLQNHGGAYHLELGDGRCYEAPPGAGFVVPPGQRHQLRVPNGGSLVSRYLLLELRTHGVIDAFRLMELPFILPPATAQIIGRIAIRLTKLWDDQSAETCLKRTVREEILALEAAHALFETADLGKCAAPGAEYRRLAPVIDWMARQASEPLQRADIAARVGVSEQHLNVLFQGAVGMPPMRFLAELRISYARELLEDSSLSIAEIADRCGYSSPEYFSRTFLAQTGLRPSAFRNCQRAS